MITAMITLIITIVIIITIIIMTIKTLTIMITNSYVMIKSNDNKIIMVTKIPLKIKIMKNNSMVKNNNW